MEVGLCGVVVGWGVVEDDVVVIDEGDGVDEVVGEVGGVGMGDGWSLLE